MPWRRSSVKRSFPTAWGHASSSEDHPGRRNLTSARRASRAAGRRAGKVVTAAGVSSGIDMALTCSTVCMVRTLPRVSSWEFASQISGRDYETETSSSSMQASVDRHELTAEQAGQGEVLGVVGLGPAELVAQLPRHRSEATMTSGADRSCFQDIEGRASLLSSSTWRRSIAAAHV